MALSNERDPTVILTDHTNYTAWFQQLQARCHSLRIWNLINPTEGDLPKVKPQLPIPPPIGSYQPSTAFLAANPGVEPTIPSQLSTVGGKAYKDDNDYHKGQVEMYKLQIQEYREEQTSLNQVVIFLQTTTSAFLQKNCFHPGQSLSQWVINVTNTVGVDLQDEYQKVRNRFQDALKPMRTPGTWHTWLTEYDHAATEAEVSQVPEVLRLESVKQDFMKAVTHVAPAWVTAFQQNGNKDITVTRKSMMKLFREYMLLQHPIKGKQRGAFAAVDRSFLAVGGESTQAADEDAHLAEERAPSRPCKRTRGKDSVTKQLPINRRPAAAGGKCPACAQPHALQDCFYANPEKAPEWFKPRPTIADLINFKMEHNPDLQAAVRALKQPRL